MMRILVLTNLYPNPVQPDRAPFNRQQLRALGREHEVRVIAPVAWTDRLRGLGRRETEGMVVEHPRVWFVPRVARGWYGWCYRESVRGTFMRAVRAFRPEVVLGSWAYPDGWAAVSLAREAGLAVVVKVHGSDVLGVWEHPGRLKGTVEALRGADGVITVSRDLGQKVVGLLEEHAPGNAMGFDGVAVHVVRNGVDSSLFYPGSRVEARGRLGLDDRPLVLFVGNLVEVKGLDVLVEACARLMGAGVEFRCCMIGEGPLRGALHSRIERLGLSSRVELLGRRPLETLGDWYRAASVLVLPSRWEGLPNVLLEGSACGAPIVASRVGGVPEIVESCGGRLVEAGDAKGLAEEVRGVIEGGGPLRGGGLWGMSWEASARALGSVLESVVKHRRGLSVVGCGRERNDPRLVAAGRPPHTRKVA